MRRTTTTVPTLYIYGAAALYKDNGECSTLRIRNRLVKTRFHSGSTHSVHPRLQFRYKKSEEQNTGPVCETPASSANFVAPPMKV
jgi:hypothetical protein